MCAECGVCWVGWVLSGVWCVCMSGVCAEWCVCMSGVGAEWDGC